MKFSEIAFTGYSVSDMSRARSFYEGVLGLEKSRGFASEGSTEDQWIEYDIGPGCLALVLGADQGWPTGSTGVAAALEVDDFEAAVERLREHKVEFAFEPYESPVCWMVVINDPDKNRIVIHKRKEGHA